MATRHLRRLKGSEDLLPTVPSSPDDPEESDGRSSEEGEGGVTLNDRHKAFNPYAFLAELDEEVSIMWDNACRCRQQQCRCVFEWVFVSVLCFESRVVL